MLPTTDAAWVGAELARRFGVPLWSFTLTATDANRWALRLARLVTGRPKVLVCNWCYHGTVDEAFVTLGEHGPVSRAGNVGPPVDPTLTTRVVEFNDLSGLAAELAAGDVAGVLMEPALTNIGIVLPLPGYLDGVRELTRRHGTLLVNDETHTFSAGPGGCTRAWSRTWSPSARPSAAASRPPPSGSPPRWPSGSPAAATPTWSTPAASAGRWRATRCRWPRCARPWSTS
jgi:glutamate-1-semialdehyde 2,1-aminomutase